MRPVRLMSDYSVGLPVWSDGGAWGGEDEARISAELAADLRAWQRLFDTGFHWDRGWYDESARLAYAREAEGLRWRLAWELDVEVELDLWPLGEAAPGA